MSQRDGDRDSKTDRLICDPWNGSRSPEFRKFERNIKCDLLHDWRTANGLRRQAVMEDEAALSNEVEDQDTRAGSVTRDDADEASINIDDEFERLVSSPS